MLEGIKNFLATAHLSNYLYIIFVSLGIILCVLVSVWVVMEIIQLSPRKKSEPILEPIPTSDPVNLSEASQVKNPEVVAAIIAAISTAKNIPGYNLRIKSFKRSDSNKW